MKACCNSKTEIHKINCTSNYPYDFYLCVRCNKPSIRHLMVLGLCQKCQIVFDKVGARAVYVMYDDGRVRWHHDLCTNNEDQKI